MVDPVRIDASNGATSADALTAPPSRRPRKLVEAHPSIEHHIDDTVALLDLVARTADASRCNAKDGPLQIGRMHAADPPTAMQVALDAFMESAASPYRAEGRTVQVAAFFRMNGGMHAVAPADESTRDAILARAGLAEEGAMVKVGRGTLSEVQRAAQALIDAGKLEAGTPETLCDRVRGMMWRYGVGIDCAGYAQRAFLDSRHADSKAFGLRRADYEDLQSLDTNRAFKRVDVEGARPGDLFILGPSGNPPRGPGHCLVVYSNKIADTQTKELLLARCGTQASGFIQGSQRLHVYQVDSSWGAGPDGASYGGVRRETWLYDEVSRTWAYYSPAQASSGGSGFVSGSDPCDHPIRGVYRPRSEP
jgi:hypothetical protein